MSNKHSKGSGEHSGEAEHVLSPALEKNYRQSDRVVVTLRIRVSGVRGNGKDFFEDGQTVDISRQGATIKVGRELFAGEIIKVQRIDGVGEEATAQVVGRVEGGSEGYVFGVTMLDPAGVNPWSVVFPAAADTDKPVLRAFLRCVDCDRTEVAYLDEFEADLFLYHHCISRMCKHCGGFTIWNRPHGRTFAGSIATMAPGTQNRRSHGRIQLEAVGCVRRPGSGNEVVVVKDLARGGLSFYSVVEYPEETRVEIAVPYTSKSPNIYTSARIVSARKTAAKGLLEYEYRATYLE
jgi:hypothetical protein